MIRALTILMLLAQSAFAASTVTVDAYLNWDLAARGTLTQTGLTNVTKGTFNKWNDHSPYTRWSVVAGSNSLSFARPITAGGIQNSGSSTNWVYGDGNTATANGFYFEVTGGADSTIHGLAVAGFVVFAQSNDTGSQINHDLVLTEPGSGGSWAVMQIILPASSSTQIMDSHSESGGSHNSSGTAVSSATAYFYILQRDNVNHLCVVKLYDPITWALVTTESSAMSDDTNYLIDWKVGYIGASPGYVMFGNQIVIYEPTTQQLSDLVTPLAGTTTGPRVTLNRGVLGTTSIQ